MALYGDVTYDSRVRREAGSLARAGYDVTIVCLAGRSPAPDLPDGVTIRVQRPRGAAVIPGSSNPFFVTRAGRLGAIRGRVAWLAKYVRGLRSWGRMAIEAAGQVDIWHAHDLTGLAAIVPHLRPGLPVVFDSHELFLETGTALRLPGPARWVLRWYERQLVSRAAAVITVNEAVATVLRNQHQATPTYAVHNCPDRWVPPPQRPTLLRDAAAIPASAPLILYHGALSANRGIEQLMEAMLEPALEGAHLALMGSGELQEHMKRAAAEGPWNDRVHVLPSVLPDELLSWVASADVGAMALQPATLNLRLSTPNKLFECLAAGTPVVVSDFPGMRGIVIDNPGGPLGAVCDPETSASIAAAIGSILQLDRAAMDTLRNRCRSAADERWNWDHEARTLLSIYADLGTPS
jgi:glycosyltransferase involved in cell wall biosynthesis